jgi:hypothetical protein
MVINRDNFEAYMLDYLEGHLDPLYTADLMVFLAENPEFECYIPDFDNSIALPDNREYSYKNLLKKEFADIAEITVANFDEFCIAACEGILEKNETDRLSLYMMLHPERSHDLDIYRKLKLSPDTAVTFIHKAILKKQTPGYLKLRKLYYAVGAVAAGVAVLVIMFMHARSRFENIEKNNNLTENVITTRNAEKDPPDSESLLAHESFNRTFVSETEKGQIDRKRTDSLIKVISAAAMPDTGIIKLMAFKPKLQLLIYNSLEPPPVPRNYIPSSSEMNISNDYSKSEGYFGFVRSKMNLWKTAETAITAFNYLTESQINLDKSMDENGRVVALLVETESYKITGK